MKDHRKKEYSDRLPEVINPDVIRKLREAIDSRKTGDVKNHSLMGLPPSGTTHISVRYTTLESLLDCWDEKEKNNDPLAQLGAPGSGVEVDSGKVEGST